MQVINSSSLRPPLPLFTSMYVVRQIMVEIKLLVMLELVLPRNWMFVYKNL